MDHGTKRSPTSEIQTSCIENDVSLFEQFNIDVSGSHTIDQLQVEKRVVLFFKTIVFSALIPNILLSRLFDEQKCIFFVSKVGRF